ncbi:unnamed protein product [Rhizoctonia solani]|uniref:CcmS related domain-containing protein n=1 Tax=Rhizoctonia solani TaxID=456999 RepID=A0A8H3ARW2_9AGAM|nr:unnamed protein product [Rhizoctonia solani]
MSEVSSGMSPTRSEALHHVRRKKPPALGQEPTNLSASSSTASSSPPKSSVSKMPADGAVRPGDIVPPDWGAAAVSVLGSAPPSVVAPTPAPGSIIGSATAFSALNPPSSYKQHQNRRSSQPQPRAPPSGYSHSHSHSQPLVSAPRLPPIAASPRTSVADAPPNPVHQRSKPPELVQEESSITLQTALKYVSPSPQSSRMHLERANPPQPSLSTQTTLSRPGGTSAGSQSLQVPPSSYAFSTVSHPAPTVAGSHISERSSQSSRALPVPPRSTVSTTQPTPPAALLNSHTPPSSIQAWRTGVTTSSPGGWGAPSHSLSTRTSQQNIFHSAYNGPVSTIPPLAPSHPSNYQVDPLQSKTQRHLHPPPPPTRRYSYDTPTGGLPLPSQLSTNLDGYTSSPDVSGREGTSSIVGNSRPKMQFDDGKPGIQRAPSKLRRKLTKSRGWVPNAPTAAAPAISTSAAAPVPKSEGALSSRSQFLSPRASSARVIQSGGQALVPAQRAFIGSHRSAQERILWGLPLDRDPRVRHAITKIEKLKEAVVTFGAEKFVDTRMKGAVICNVDYNPPNHPDDLAFDWITYKDAQKSLDSTLQKSITRTDPANTVLVVIFLLSPSLNSLAIWRKSLAIDHAKFDRVLAYKVDKVKRETAEREKDMTIRL